jgi:GT2 family glycosyltransferase
MKWNFAPLEQNFKYAAVGMKGSDDRNNNLEMDFFLSDIIDSLGLKIFRSRRVIDQYAGENWECIKNKFNAHVLEVFGVSGTCPMYRKSTLDRVAFENKNFFDELYHSYKEDVDLAFRLNLAGYKSYVHLESVVYHDRTASGDKNPSDIAASKNKKTQSGWVKYHSYKNQLMTLYKNETGRNFLLDFSFILWYEVKKFVWFLIFDRSVLAGLKEIWKYRKELKKKRQSIQSKKVSQNTLQKWFKK